MTIEHAHAALADAWAVLGGVHAVGGGGAIAEVPGMRLMTSGLPPPQWNAADVTDAASADIDAARAFFAAHGVAWGARVPEPVPWSRGPKVAELRLMGLDSRKLVMVPAPAGVTCRAAVAADLDAVLAVDAAAFDGDPDESRPWMAPLLADERATVALASLDDGIPVATAYSVRSDGRAGPCAYLAGVAVVEQARRRGIGAHLSFSLLERAATAGAVHAHLHADTQAAARLYARLGFADTGVLAVYAE